MFVLLSCSILSSAFLSRGLDCFLFLVSWPEARESFFFLKARESCKWMCCTDRTWPCLPVRKKSQVVIYVKNYAERYYWNISGITIKPIAGLFKRYSLRQKLLCILCLVKVKLFKFWPNILGKLSITMKLNTCNMKIYFMTILMMIILYYKY
jgi:hypothetical protein